MGNSQFHLREEDTQSIYDVVHEILCEFRTNLVRIMFLKIHNRSVESVEDGDDSDDELTFNFTSENLGFGKR